MWYFQLSILCMLLSVPFHNLAKPLAPHWDHIRVKHTWDDVPLNWESLGPPPAGTTINLDIVLMPQNENALIDALYEVSDPSSSKNVLFKTLPGTMCSCVPFSVVDTLELVHSWLENHGIPPSFISMTHGGSWLTLTGVPVPRANELLGASYQLYRPTAMNDTAILRTIGYSLPTVLHAHVRTVVPTTFFSTRPPWQTPQSRPVNTTADMKTRGLGGMLSNRANALVKPSVLRSLYRMAEYVPAAADQNVLGVTGFLNQYPSPADFIKFMTECRSDAVNPGFTLVPVNGGGYDPNNPGHEASSNIQYSEALVYPTPIIFYSTGGGVEISPDTNKPATGDLFMEWLKFVLDREKVPQTITMSYSILEKYLPSEYASTICLKFAELGARGASVLIASGNLAVGGQGECLDGSGTIQFLTEFPPTCPFVTSVGGTTGQLEAVGASFSGGGFSSIFPRPPYQGVAVTRFLQQLGSRYEGLYHPLGRGIPDISAQATDYYAIWDDVPYSLSGTSLAAPTVAAIITLLNDYRLSTGRASLGFLNPWLYGHGLKAIHDVTSGSNPGCNTEGFSAIPGWDPVTGLGTPDFLLLQYTLDYIPTPPGPGN